MEQKIKTLGSLIAGPMRVFLDQVRLVDDQHKMRIKIEYPEAAALLAFVDREHVLLVRQFRYAVGHETLEIPAGKVDPGEDPAACALRELREETGYRAEKLEPLFTYYPAVGYSSEKLTLFAAAGLKRCSDIEDQAEIAGVEQWRISDVLDWIHSGQIIDAKTALGIMACQSGQAVTWLADAFPDEA